MVPSYGNLQHLVHWAVPGRQRHVPCTPMHRCRRHPVPFGPMVPGACAGSTALHLVPAGWAASPGLLPVAQMSWFWGQGGAPAALAAQTRIRFGVSWENRHRCEAEFGGYFTGTVLFVPILYLERPE